MSQSALKLRRRSSALPRAATITVLALSLGFGVIAAPSAHASSLAAHVAGPRKGKDCVKHPHNPGCPVSTGPVSTGTATPELSSGELVATGILPIGAVLLYRRRRSRRTQDHTTV